jgi:hypothetical protein
VHQLDEVLAAVHEVAVAAERRRRGGQQDRAARGGDLGREPDRLRQAFDREGEGPGIGLYFGATSGDVFGSGDAGGSWFTVRERLAPVNSVRVA